MNMLNRRAALKGLMLGAAGSWAAPTALATEREAARTQPAEQWPAVDVLVIGGGPAGIAAALMAARAGRKTLLVERSGRLGGMAVQALVGPLMGNVRSKLVDEILEHIGGRKVDYEFVDLKYAELLLTAGCQVLLHAWCAEPLLEGQRVTGARLVTKQGMIEVRAKVTVDATGDGDVAYGAGAEFDQGRGAGPNWKADGLVQPMSIMFRVAGVNHEESMDAKGGRGAYRFPDGRTWNQFCKDANAAGELPPTVGMVRTYSSLRSDERVINATQINRVDGTKVKDLTQAELEGRKQVQLVMEFLKKHAPGFMDAYVSAMPAMVGVRETRRIRGVETLVVDDLFAGRKWPSAIVREASFPIDIHNPDGIGQAQGVSEKSPLGKDPKVKPYDIPYGCLVPRSVNGLLVAGRCISGSHEALASYRVQVIALATGLAAGVGAAEAAHLGLEPRAVDVAAIQRVVFAA
ncbi:MAG: FAD-dependent oxidoreductase [Kiritimatiellaeota bacterium]|nr:FAD-dependent oxidoreductase [Kiritimatiellota bacterium]